MFLMTMPMSVTIFHVAQIVDDYGVHESVYGENKKCYRLVKCGKGFAEKGMSCAAVRKQIKRVIIECSMARNSKEWMRPLETNDIRQQTD